LPIKNLENLQADHFGVYFDELGKLAATIIESIDRVVDEAPAPLADDKGFILGSGKNDLHGNAYRALIAAASIRKLLYPGKPNKYDKDPGSAEFRQRRGKLLLQAMKGIDVAGVLTNEVRDSLEHYDERLDEIHRRAFASSKPAAAFAYTSDGVLTSRRAIQGTTYLRVYISDERKYAIMGHEADFRKIRGIAVEILKRVRRDENDPRLMSMYLLPTNLL
jgi:hypothetical protein